MAKIIIGLGNPGQNYARTRHNAGWWLLDDAARRTGADFAAKRALAALAARLPQSGTTLLKPQTFMNNSGECALAAARFFKTPAEDTLVAHDEVDLPPGAIKLKQGGGDAGHRGLADISRAIGRDYWRLRIGVGRPSQPEDGALRDYVLRAPAIAEQQQINSAIARALAVWDHLLAGNYQTAMQMLHTV